MAFFQVELFSFFTGDHRLAGWQGLRDFIEQFPCQIVGQQRKAYKEAEVAGNGWSEDTWSGLS